MGQPRGAGRTSPFPRGQARFPWVIRWLGLAPSSLTVWLPRRLLKGLNEMMHAEHLMQCLGQSRGSAGLGRGRQTAPGRVGVRRSAGPASLTAARDGGSLRHFLFAAPPSPASSLLPSTPTPQPSPERRRPKPRFLEGSDLPRRRFCQQGRPREHATCVVPQGPVFGLTL